MNENRPAETVIPFGMYSVILDTSTKGWREFIYAKSLRLEGNKDSQHLFAVPPRSKSLVGYPCEPCVSTDVGNSTLLELIEKAGDRRVTSIWREARPDQSVVWSYSDSLSRRGLAPSRIQVYPDLEKLLDYLITHG